MPAVASGLTSGPTTVRDDLHRSRRRLVDLDRHRRPLFRIGSVGAARRRGLRLLLSALDLAAEVADHLRGALEEPPAGRRLEQRVDLRFDVGAIGRQALREIGGLQVRIQPKARIARNASVTTVSTAGRLGTESCRSHRTGGASAKLEQHRESERHEDVAAEIERRDHDDDDRELQERRGAVRRRQVRSAVVRPGSGSW